MTGKQGHVTRSQGLAASHLQVNTYPGVTGLGVAVVCFTATYEADLIS